MLKCEVHWFDNLSQEGLIRVPGQGSVYINNDPVHGYRLNNGEPLKLASGDTVYCEVYIDYNWKQISKIEVKK